MMAMPEDDYGALVAAIDRAGEPCECVPQHRMRGYRCRSCHEKDHTLCEILAARDVRGMPTVEIWSAGRSARETWRQREWVGVGE